MIILSETTRITFSQNLELGQWIFSYFIPSTTVCEYIYWLSTSSTDQFQSCNNTLVIIFRITEHLHQDILQYDNDKFLSEFTENLWEYTKTNILTLPYLFVKYVWGWFG